MSKNETKLKEYSETLMNEIKEKIFELTDDITEMAADIEEREDQSLSVIESRRDDLARLEAEIKEERAVIENQRAEVCS